VKFIGADNVIDYKNEDFTENGEKYDIIYDVLNKSSFNKCKNSLNDNGIYVLVSFKMKQVFQMFKTLFSNGKKVKCMLAVENQKDLEYIKKLVEDGVLKTEIDRIFSMEDAVEAHKYVESGLNRSNVILKIP
jgi:NADPH:quinone reductase-like Zn-dependent oxidoreductase